MNDCKECTPDQPCKKHWQRKLGESESDYDNRRLLYELTGIRDESMHIKPYADMIDKLSYVQKADFAKRAIELERDCATYKAMLAEINKERDAWISEYRTTMVSVERLKLCNDNLAKELREADSRVLAHAETIERLESDLTEAVEIMEAIYSNVDQYHLDFAFHGGECYDKLKDYLGV